MDFPFMVHYSWGPFKVPFLSLYKLLPDYSEAFVIQYWLERNTCLSINVIIMSTIPDHTIILLHIATSTKIFE